MSAGNIKVFVVEDNDGDAHLIEEALVTSEQFDCEVMRFRDGGEALSALLREDISAPDVVLLDLNMPRSNGLDILRHIRNTPRLTYTKVGILTGSLETGDKLRASVIGATYYILKPKTHEEYIRSVRQAVSDMLEPTKPANS